MYKFLLNILTCVFLLNYSIRYVRCECCCDLKSKFTSKVNSKSKNFLPKPPVTNTINTNNTLSTINNIKTPNIKIPSINTNTTSYINNNIEISNTDNTTSCINNKIKIPNINGTLSVYIDDLSVNPTIKSSSNIVNNADGFKSIYINSITDNNFICKPASSKIIKNRNEHLLITNKIKVNLNLDVRNLKLLYRATSDSDKAEVFHEKCDQAKSTIVLIETNNCKRFGGFTTCSWSGNCEDKKDKSAFIFSLDKMKTYNNISEEEAIGCYPTFGPIFLGCQIRIYDNAFTKGGTTFEKGMSFETEEDYELTGGDQRFKVKEIEVYEVIFNQ